MIMEMIRDDGVLLNKRYGRRADHQRIDEVTDDGDDDGVGGSGSKETQLQ